MSEIFDSVPPPTSTLAPPGSPHEQAGGELAVPDCSPPIGSHRASTPSHPSRSVVPPLIRHLGVSFVLENNGSVARDHLASERTFLAYVRTSLVVASTGVALVQLFTISSNTTTDDKLSFIPTTQNLQAWARPLGATMVGFGIVVLALGTTRYFRIQSALTQGKFPIARVTAASITFVLGTITILVFAIMLSARK